MTDEKDTSGDNADDLAEKIFGIEPNIDDDGNVGSELLFDDYDEGSSLDGLLNAEPADDLSADDDDIDFDRQDKEDDDTGSAGYSDEIDDDLILFSDDDEEEEDDVDDETEEVEFEDEDDE